VFLTLELLLFSLQPIFRDIVFHFVLSVSQVTAVLTRQRLCTTFSMLCVVNFVFVT